MMNKRYPGRLKWSPLLLGVWAGLSSYLCASGSASAKDIAPVRRQLIESYGRIPLSFEQNHGQADGAVKFLSRGQRYSLLLLSDKALLTLKSPSANFMAIGLKFIGARSTISVRGLDK